MTAQIQKPLPLVAIVGRPNVGKSTLFNRIAAADKAIAHSAPGVTRDRIYADVEWGGRRFSVIDTAGLEPLGGGGSAGAREQAEIAIEQAGAVVMLLSAADGALPEDAEILRLLRKSGRKIFCFVNKIDREKDERLRWDFHSLGEPVLRSVSALNGRGVYELLDEIAGALPCEKRPERGKNAPRPVRIAIIGKPNVGKSTLVNTLAGNERMLTSPSPGTTRDAVDVPLEYRERQWILTDTAGVRKKAAVSGPVERLATLKAIRAIAACDIAALMIDAREGPSRQDTRLAELIEDRAKPAVVVLNKWDLAPADVLKITDIRKKTVAALSGALGFSQVVKISALTGRGVHRLFDSALKALASHEKKVPTKKLNSFIQKAASAGPSVLKGRELKAYYMAQVRTRPPGFVIFTNSPRGPVPAHYSKYIERRLREEFGFEGAPIRIFFREREKTGAHRRAASSRTD